MVIKKVTFKLDMETPNKNFQIKPLILSMLFTPNLLILKFKKINISSPFPPFDLTFLTFPIIYMIYEQIHIILVDILIFRKGKNLGFAIV